MEFTYTRTKSKLYNSTSKINMVDINGYEIKSAFSGGEPLKAIYSLGEKVWPVSGPGPVPVDWGGLKFTVLEPGIIRMLHVGTNKTTTKPNLSYSKNGGSWVEWDYSQISVNEGDVVYFKGINYSIGSANRPDELYANNYSTFYSNCKFTASGNIMSLLYGDDYEGKLILPAYCFYELFSYYSKLTSAYELELPANKLSFMCYFGIFLQCEYLTTAPKKLPATTVPEYAYASMFQGCTSLTTAPEIFANKLSENCFQQMFQGCTSLNIAPELYSNTLEAGCYNTMFRDCTKLNYIKANFLTEPGDYYTSYWLAGVSSTGTFVANPKAKWTDTIERGIDTVPAGWTITK